MKLIEISAIPLKEEETDFAMDSSGFSTAMYGHWLTKRHVFNDYKHFKKAHVMYGVKTNVITNIEVTDGYTGDSTILEELVRSTAKNFRMKEVSADKGYLSERNMVIILANGAIPFIPFKRNSKESPENRLPIWKIMFRMFRYNKEEFNRHYHKRSNVESAFSMIKRKFGIYIRGKTSQVQENEVLCKALCHNICVLIEEMFELGIKVDFSEIGPQQFMCKATITIFQAGSAACGSFRY
jgi:transposase